MAKVSELKRKYIEDRIRWVCFAIKCSMCRNNGDTNADFIYDLISVHEHCAFLLGQNNPNIDWYHG